MKWFYRLFGFYPDVKFLILLLTLILLSIPEIIRYRIRPYLDEWTMNLIASAKSKKYRKKEARKMKKMFMFFIALAAVLLFSGEAAAQARTRDYRSYRGDHRGSSHRNHGFDGREYFYRSERFSRQYHYRRDYYSDSFSYRHHERWSRSYRYWAPHYYDYRYFHYYPRRIWISGYWDWQWTPCGWTRVWIPGCWQQVY